MKTTTCSLLLLGSLATLPAAAQTPATPTAPATPAATGTITGLVTDSLSRQPLPFAAVLLQPATGTPLSTVADEHGRFVLTAVPAATYTLQGQYLGYRPVAAAPATLAAGGRLELTLALAPAAQRLRGVTVAAARPQVEQHAGKLVVNVAGSPLAAGGTAAEVLARVPGLQSQANGYQLRGRKVLVLLDGKPTYLQGEELRALLGSMGAGSIERVELLASPPARYDAEGGAVLNIVSTKGAGYGTNGSVTTGVGLGHYGRYNAGLTLNHRTQHLNVYGGLDHLSYQPTGELRSNRPLTSEVGLRETTTSVRLLRSNTLRLGLDYDLNARSALGVQLRGLLNYRNQTSLTHSEQVADGALLRASEVATHGEAHVASPAASVYYRLRLDSLQRELRLSADYFGYAKNWHNDYATRYLAPDGTDAAPTDRLRDTSPARNAVYAAAADYTHPGLYGGTLEAGLKTTFTRTDNDIRWEQSTAGQPWAIDLGKTNHFIYQENINAAYLSYARPLKGLNLQLGLRAEQTNTVGTSRTLGLSTTRHYLNLFPSVSVDFTRRTNHQFGLAYRQKIDRFRFGLVNPFVTYISQYSYAQGNPAIRPSLSHNMELSYSYKGELTAALSYAYHTHALIETFRRTPGSDVVVNTYQNYPSAHSLDATVSWMKTYLDGRWSAMTTLGLSYARVQGGIGLSAARPAAFVQSSHTILLPQGFKLEVAGSYSSPLTFGGLAYRSRYALDMGLSKTVMQGAGTFTLNVSDVFNTQRNRYDVLSGGINGYTTDHPESRFVRLGFNYKFGNRKVKASKRRDTGIETEKRRMELN